MRRSVDLSLLVIALLLSQFLIMEYTIHNGFEFHGLKIKIGSLLIIKNSSQATTLTSALLGYILFLVFLLIHYKNPKARESRLYDLTLFAAILIVFFELRSIYLEAFNLYGGQRLTVGIGLFLLCFKIYHTIYRKVSHDIPLHQNGHGKVI